MDDRYKNRVLRLRQHVLSHNEEVFIDAEETESNNSISLNEMTIAELKDELDLLEIKYTTKDNKDELINKVLEYRNRGD